MSRTGSRRGVPVGGEFAVRALAENPGALGTPAPTYLERLTALHERNYAQPLADTVASEELARFQDQGFDVGDAVAYTERYGHRTYDRRAEKDLPMLNAPGFTLDDVDALTERFGREEPAWECLHAGISPDRAAELADLGVHFSGAMISLNPIGDAVITEWVTSMRARPDMRTWVGNVENIPLLHAAGVTPDRAFECDSLDIDQETARIVPAIDPQLLHQYATRAKMPTAPAAERLLAGLTTKLAASFGPRISPEDTVALDNALVPGQVARSLRAKNSSLTATEIIELHYAKVSTGADYAAWREVTTAAHEPHRIAELAAAGLTIAQAAGYAKNQFPIAYWVELHESDFGDAAQWTKAGLERRSQWGGGQEHLASHLAAYARASAATRHGSVRCLAPASPSTGRLRSTTPATCGLTGNRSAQPPWRTKSACTPPGGTSRPPRRRGPGPRPPTRKGSRRHDRAATQAHRPGPGGGVDE